MNTPINVNDPRLIDFVLGELEAEEAAKLNAALQLPENQEALQETETLRAAINISKAALKNDAVTSVNGLSETRRQVVLETARLQGGPRQKRSMRWGTRLVAAAAILLLCLGLALYFVNELKPGIDTMIAMNNQTDARAPADTGTQFPLEAFPTETSSTIPVPKESVEGQKGEAASTAEAPDGDEESVPVPIPTPEPEPAEPEIALPVPVPPPAALSVPEMEPVAPEPVSAPESEPVELVHAPSREPEGKEVLVEKYAPVQRSGRAARPTSKRNEVRYYAEPPSMTVAPADARTVSPKENRIQEPLPASPPVEMPQAESTSVVDEEVVSGDLYPDVYISGGNYTAMLNLNLVQDKKKVERGEAYIIPPPHPPYPGGELYSEIKEQPFQRTDEAPLSTFSLHPDTAAYTNIKRFLEQGQRPPVNAVRIEEMMNYFKYNYPQPTGRHPFSVNIEVGPCPWASDHLLAKIGLQGRDLPRQERPAANLVFLIDTSGSMDAPNRLPLVKESLKTLVELLEPEDRVGIVTYAGSSQVALKSTPLSKRDRIVTAIEGLSAGGSTHGSAGIQDAYDLAEKHMIEEGINRVILATDGDFNVGVTSHEGLLSLIEKKRRSGIFLTVLGYGMGNLKDANLETLATKGNGNYAYIGSYSEARRILVEQLTGTLMTIAKDAKIQVEFNPARVRSYRLIGFENRQLAHRDFNDDTKDAGEIGAGHSVTALYQIVPVGAPVEPGVDDLRYQEPEREPTPKPDAKEELLFVKLRYKAPDNDTSVLMEVPVPARSVNLEESTNNFRFVSAVAAFGLVLRDSAYKGDADFEMIRKLATGALGEDPRREEFLDLVVTAKTLINP